VRSGGERGEVPEGKEKDFDWGGRKRCLSSEAAFIQGGGGTVGQKEKGASSSCGKKGK